MDEFFNKRSVIFSRLLKRLLGFLIVTTFVSASGHGQTLSRDYDDFLPNGGFLQQLASFPDGGFAAVGTWLDPSNRRQLFLLRFDSQGDTLWTQKWAWDVVAVNFERFLTSPRFSPTLCGSITDSSGSAISRTAFMLQLDSLGDSLHLLSSAFSNLGGSRFFDIDVTAGGGRILCGTQFGGNALFVRTNTLGDTLWTKTLAGFAGGAANIFANKAVELPGGGFAALGASNPASPVDWRLIRLNPSGDTLGTKSIPPSFLPENLIPTSDGGFLLSGRYSPPAACIPPAVHATAAVLKLDSLGDSISTIQLQDCLPPTNLVPSQFQRTLALQHDSEGNILVQGWRIGNLYSTASPTDTATASPFILLLDPTGEDSLASHTFAYQGRTDAMSFTQDGGLLFFGDKNDSERYFNITRLYPSGPEPITGGNISGRIFWDQDFDCLPDSALLPRPVLLRAMPGGFLSLSDSNGRFSFSLPQGIYDISLHDSFPYLEAACTTIHQVNLFDSLEAEGLEFALRAKGNCPLLTIDVGTAYLLPCSTSTYHVQYGNVGTDTAYASTIELEFDPELSVLSASIPWQIQNGQHYTFATGDLAPGETGAFTIEATLSCAALPAQSHCVEALISPDSVCFPLDSNWNGAVLEAKAECNATNDTAIVTLRNVGSAAVTTGGIVLVLEDNVMKTSFVWQPGAGQDTILEYPANGATWYVRARQPAGFPLSAYAIDALEGCGTDSTGQFTTGLIGSLPLQTSNFFKAVECQQAIGPGSAKEKSATPKGFGPQGYIEPEDALTYTIRFQNTGQDTAINVRVLDSLSPLLDPSSLQMLSASHPNRFCIDGEGILNVFFPEIKLPDSASDPIGSRGYFKFRIAQQSGNLPGERIENTAFLHFDLQNPLHTNTTVQTLLEDVIGLVEVEEYMTQESHLSVYPNPFSDQVRFQLDLQGPQNLELELYDLQGRQLERIEARRSMGLWLSAGHLPPGLYVFRLKAGGNAMATGKLIRR